MEGEDRHTCEMYSYRIYGKTKEQSTVKPLVYGDAAGSGMEGEKLDQVGYLYSNPSSQRGPRGDTDNAILTVPQGGEWHLVNRNIQKNETIRIGENGKYCSHQRRDSHKHYLSINLVISERILRNGYGPRSEYNKY